MLEEDQNEYNILVYYNLNGTDHLGDLDVGEWIMLKWL